jgi:cyclopropane-fatty-acyl-phospholipid synthase
MTILIDHPSGRPSPDRSNAAASGGTSVGDPGAAPAAPFDARFEPPARHTAVTRGRVARALVGRAARSAGVRMAHPDGTSTGSPDPKAPTVLVQEPTGFYRRLETHPKIGVGEGYQAGQWRPAPGSDLADVMAPFAARLDRVLPSWLLRLRGVVDRALPHAHRNTPEGSQANIHAHYDLGNDLFEAFLDPTMTYSSALFDPARPMAEQDLETAQLRKIDAALDAAGVAPGSRVLEIGTGWGALAIRAAQRGAHVTSITLSTEQAALARQRVIAAGLAGRVDVRVQDYRSTTGRYDAVVSIEMIEAVGEEFWPAYLATLDAALVPGGRAVIQAILMRHDRLLATRHSFGWIQKYIFPGGLIPSLEAIEQVSERHTALRVQEVRRFGADYAETLRRWRRAFLAAWPHLAARGYDETFRRTWELYLAYSEAGFATGYLDVAQLTLTRPQER